jgi:hypothetical protein
MRYFNRVIAALLAAALLFAAAPSRSDAQGASSLLSTLLSLVLNSAPPALPQYYQPAVDQPNQIWQPGYWSWGPGGYFWVPGTWVTPLQPGLLWTPGYWASNGSGYTWTPGYWAQNVGYYGGINYGNGYYGTGYTGGRWNGNDFNYNTAVTNVNTTYVRYVYVDRTVLVNRYRGNFISYNGGTGGISARPTSREIQVRRERHYPMTDLQRQHFAVAAQNRNYLARVNHGHPAAVSVRKPLSSDNRPPGFTPIRSTDRIAAPTPHRAMPARHAAPVVHTHAAPAMHVAPARHAAPAMHVAPARHAAPAMHVAPARHAAPAMHVAPARHAAPAMHVAPARHAAPVTHAPAKPKGNPHASPHP